MAIGRLVVTLLMFFSLKLKIPFQYTYTRNKWGRMATSDTFTQLQNLTTNNKVGLRNMWHGMHTKGRLNDERIAFSIPFNIDIKNLL